MKTVLKYKFWSLVLSFIFVIFLFLSCQTANNNSKILAPVDVELSFSNPPDLNAETTLTFRVKQLVYDSPDTVVVFTVPDEFQIISGDIRWQGPMSVNEIREFKLTIRTLKTGNYSVKANALSLGQGGVISWGKPDTLYITITNIGAIVSRVPPFTFVPNPGFSYSTRIYTTAEP